MMQGTLWAWWPMWCQRGWSHGAKVNIVYDHGPNGYYVYKNVETEKPTWEGSYGVPLFDGNDRMYQGTPIIPVMNGASYDRLLSWAVVHNLVGLTSAKIWGHHNWTGNAGTALGCNTGYRGWEFAATNGWNDSPGPSTFGPKTVDVAYIVCSAGKTLADCFVRECGIDRTTHRNPAAMVNRSGGLHIGANALGAEQWRGGIAEVGAVLNHTDQDLEQLEKYLKSFYGF
jgi:hypothetical protein